MDVMMSVVVVVAAIMMMNSLSALAVGFTQACTGWNCSRWRIQVTARSSNTHSDTTSVTQQQTPVAIVQLIAVWPMLMSVQVEVKGSTPLVAVQPH